MENRETKEITTPNGTKVVVKTYLTARESNQLKSLIWGHLQVNVQDGQIANSIPGNVLFEQERKTLEIAVVSVNGVSDAVLDKLDDLTQDDYQFVVAAVNEVSKLNFKPTK